MPRQRPKAAFHKHTEYMSGPDFNSNTIVPEFSVRFNLPFLEKDQFKYHFRADFFNVLLIVKGEVKVFINHEKYTASKDNLIIVAPQTIKKVEMVSNDTLVSGVNFTIDFLTAIGMPKIAVELLDYFSSQFSPYWELDRKDAAVVQLHMKQLNERITSLDDKAYGRELLYHSFYIFLYEVYGLSKKYAAEFNPHITTKENLVKNFTRLVQQQFRTNRIVATYAEHLSITPKYLTETVKEITGKTAGEIIDSYVMLEAKLMLDDPLLSIAQIADELHFSDQSFFGKFFKRHAGVSPKQYRQ